MPDSTLQERFDALRAESDPPGRRVDAGTVISRARRRRAGRVALAAAAVLAVMGVAVPALIGTADRNEPVDTGGSSPLADALDPATEQWLGPWETADEDQLRRLPDPQMSTIGCFNDGESARAMTGYALAWTLTPAQPAGALASTVVSKHRSPAVAKSLVPGITGRVRPAGAPWCAKASDPVRLTAPGQVTGTYRQLPLDPVYSFIERAQEDAPGNDLPAGYLVDLPRGYVLHVWSLANGDRAGMLAIAAPEDVGAPKAGAVFEAFSGFMTTDAALGNSTPYGNDR